MEVLTVLSCFHAEKMVIEFCRDGLRFYHRWFFNVVGDSRCPISDTWWQTETGGFMVGLGLSMFVYCAKSTKHIFETEIYNLHFLSHHVFSSSSCYSTYNAISKDPLLSCRLLLYRVPGHRSLVLLLFPFLVSKYVY